MNKKITILTLRYEFMTFFDQANLLLIAFLQIDAIRDRVMDPYWSPSHEE